MRRVSIVPAAVIWGLFGIVAIEIIITYARIPPDELYHVSGTGAAGGFGRALVFLNFPVALAALPLVALAADRLLQRRAAVAAAVLSAALCAVVFWPGVVDQADLDPKPINALSAAGVALVVVLTAFSGLLRVRARVHPALIAFAVVLLILAIPWVAAELGFYLDGVPVLRRIFLTQTLYEGHPATVPLVREATRRPLRIVAGIYVGLQLAYGLANFANDAWLEQVVKRGWVDTAIPSVLNPTVSLSWLGIVIAALVFSLPVLRPAPHGRPEPASRG
jgi:hypothetical protein